MPLFANATHLLQPMDVACFRPLKYNWRQAVHDWKAKTTLPSLSKEIFCQLFSEVVTKTLKPELLQSGFEVCGLCPFDPDRINYDKLLTKKEFFSDETASDGEKEDRQKFRQQFLEILGTAKMNEFSTFYALDRTSEWTGDVRDTNLYAVWKTIIERVHDEFEEPEQQGESELQNDVNDWIGATDFILAEDIDYHIEEEVATEQSGIRVLENIQLIPPRSVCDVRNIMEQNVDVSF